MLSCFTGPKKNLKPFKVRNITGDKRCGIAAKSISDLKAKTRERFGVKSGAEISLVLEEDGTEVDEDDYLQTLPHNIVLVIVTEGQHWAGALSLVEAALTSLFRVTHLPDAAEQIRAAMEDEGSALRLDVLGKLSATLSLNVGAEGRADDKSWFSGIPPKYKTKTAFMREKARVRVRGYLYHTKDFISKHQVKPPVRKRLESVLDDFILKLKQDDYFSDYFARTSARHKVMMCDIDGWFPCEGAFDTVNCHHVDHRINPYGSRDTRILFSTWDLDHGVEKSRAVLPCLKYAASTADSSQQLNSLYFYQLLFTRHNLKLVHPVCHDKSGHTTAKCDKDRVFL